MEQRVINGYPCYIVEETDNAILCKRVDVVGFYEVHTKHPRNDRAQPENRFYKTTDNFDKAKKHYNDKK